MVEPRTFSITLRMDENGVFHKVDNKDLSLIPDEELFAAWNENPEFVEDEESIASLAPTTEFRNRTEELEVRNEINFVRQRDWFDPQEHPDTSVTMVGCGGIGSPTALALSKLGIPHLHLIDFDEVEAHNIPNQMFTMDHAGISKVDALEAMCEAFGAPQIYTHEGRGEDFPECFKGIVVTGLDNMDARKAMWELTKENKDQVDFYIDARLGGQDIVVYSFDPKDETAVEFYEMFALFPQEEAVEAPCTAQSIIDVSFVVAALITRAIRKHVTGDKVETVVQFSQDDLTITKG